MNSRKTNGGPITFTPPGARPFIPHHPSLSCVPGSQADRPDPACRDVPLLVIIHQAVVADYPAILAHEQGRAEHGTLQ
jgi:hypothetical protein